MPKRPQVPSTIEDIARQLGLSAMTVSRALRGRPNVSEVTRRKVLQAAQELSYKPNRWARSLVTRTSHIIGIVVPDISHTYFAEIARGVEETIDSEGYDLLLCHSRRDPERERRELDMLMGSRVDGLIVASEQQEDDPKTFVELQERGVPFVLIDRFFRGLDCPFVGVDDRAIGKLATEHLIRLGHTSIAHISGPAVSTGLLRYDGYLKAMKAGGIAVNPTWTVKSSFDTDGGREAMTRMLARKPRPTAVFAANDPSAIGVIEACRDAGLRIPADISIVGAGNIEGTIHPNPFLTTVDWPRLELGREAAKMLLRLISPGQKRQINRKIFAPRLLARQSTGAPKR
jgi:LacI family transcriptional regulator